MWRHDAICNPRHDSILECQAGRAEVGGVFIQRLTCLLVVDQRRGEGRQLNDRSKERGQPGERVPRVLERTSRLEFTLLLGNSSSGATCFDDVHSSSIGY